jgi:hypothetical protein
LIQGIYPNEDEGCTICTRFEKNLLSISSLDKKGFRVSFIDGEVLMWPKGKTIEDAIVIGTEEGGLYKLKGHSEAALTHSIENPCELWHRRLAHINYKALPYVSKEVTGLPEFKVDHEGVCNGCAQGNDHMDIGGHPPFPTGSKQFSGNFGNLLFLAVFTSGAILRA